MTTLRASSLRHIEQAVAMTIRQIPTATWTSLLGVVSISSLQLGQFSALLVAKLVAEIPVAGITPSQDRIGEMIRDAVAQLRAASAASISTVGGLSRLLVQGVVGATLCRVSANCIMGGQLGKVSRQLRENLTIFQPQ